MIDHIRAADVPTWAQQCAQDDGKAPVVLDVREAWEVQLASVKPNGFELKHMPMASIPMRLAELDRDTPIACLCHHGARSAQVAYFLKNQGFETVVNIHGGIDAWSAQVDPTVTRY